MVTFQLEGRLSRPWLEELEQCWKHTLASNGKSTLRVDLTGLTFADDAGKKCLAAMHRQGAEFVAADCLTKDIVAEISQAFPPNHQRPTCEGENPPSRNGSAT
jgi:hypothetical protein